MHPTKNDLPADSRAAMVALLNARLADALDLYTHAKQAHWNVKGPNFAALHGLFDDVSGHSLDWADTLAERAVALGGQALGTAATVAKTTALPSLPDGGERRGHAGGEPRHLRRGLRRRGARGHRHRRRRGRQGHERPLYGPLP